MAAQKNGRGAMLRRFLAVSLLALSCSSRLMRGVDGQLDPNYYATTCPNVETIARNAFLNRVSFFNIISLPANILRLSFHDCAVDGCEGSVLLSSNSDGTITDEKLSSHNIGIGNLPVIEYMKQQIDSQCYDNATNSPIVSCADTLALAGREAYNFAKGLAGLGSTIIPIGLGRRDGVMAQTSHADEQLLPADTTVSTVLQNFGRIGLNTEQSVALLGSHTIGVAHCANVVNRLYPTLDSTLSQPQNFPFAMKLQLNCPDQTYSESTVINNDQTNTFFDSQYFMNVDLGQGLLTIDDNIRLDSRTSGYVQAFSFNQQNFFDVFAEAYLILTSWRVLTGTQGEIRTDCTAVNS